VRRTVRYGALNLDWLQEMAREEYRGQTSEFR